jgi:hypothetical protein
MRYRANDHLGDGVAINGVSGGPAFAMTDGDVDVQMVGVVSAYVPNRLTGETLPGLAVVTDCAEFHDMVAGFKSLEEAQSQQTLPEAAPAVPAREPLPPPPSEEGTKTKL